MTYFLVSFLYLIGGLKIYSVGVKKLIYVLIFLILLSQSFYLSFYTDMLEDTSGLFIVDEYSLVLSLILTLVTFFSYIRFKSKIVSSYYSDEMGFLLFSLLRLSSLLVFRSSVSFWVYFGYEMSLIPIIIMIIIWGSYPERIGSRLVILLYTIFFRFPLIGVLLYIYFGLSTLNLTFLISSPLPLLFSCVIFISFAVKLPVYGLHYWLPLAHVEAPTFGSILLAGILLKLGGCAIYRFLYLIPSQYSSLLRVLTWVILTGAIISSLVCCIQSDIKRLIAYSSVVHITSVGLVLLLSITISYKRALIIMIMHGVSSPLLFYTVGELYDKLGTRSILLIRGLYLFSPVLFWSIVISFFLGVPVPPSFGFIGEVILFTSLIYLDSLFIVVSFIYIFIAVVFNLYWFTTRFGYYSNNGVSAPLTVCSSWVFMYLPILGMLLVLYRYLF